MAPEIVFPNMNISIQHLDRVCFSLFGMPVYWYGVTLTFAILCAAAYSASEAKRLGYGAEIIYDYLIFGLICAIIGARIYYVLFSLDSYKDDLIKIFAVREGGLAIYGGIIGGTTALIFFAKAKKMKVSALADIIAPGLALGQAIGRWGNFINKEAFGGFTDNFFAMRYLAEAVRFIPDSLRDTIITVNGADYIQVHPTFLYESLWCLDIFIVLLFCRDKKKFDGELTALYFLLYGCGRIWIEGLRCDQLQLGNSGIAVSQVLSGIVIALSLIYISYNRKNVSRG